MSIVKNALSIFGRDSLLTITNILTGIFIARSLGPEILGLWFILNLIPVYAEGFLRSKADIASVYFFGKKKYKDYEIISSLNIVALATSFIFIIFVYLFSDFLYSYLFTNSTINLKLEFFIILIQIPLQFLSLNYSYYHIAIDNITVYNKKIIFQSFSYSLISISLIYLLNLGLWSVIIASIFGHLISLIYGYIKVNNNIRYKYSFNLNLTKSIIKYGFNFYVSGILSFFQNEGIKSISLFFLKSSGIAFLGQGQNIGQLLNKINQSVETIIYPNISRAKSKIDSLKLTLKSYRLTLILLTLSSITLYLLSDLIITTLYGENFINTSMVLKVILPGLVFYGSSSVLNSFFQGTGKANFIPRIIFFPILIQLIIGYFLTKSYGLIGAAYSISIGFALQSIFILFSFILINKLSVKRLIIKRKDFLDIYLYIYNYLINKR